MEKRPQKKQIIRFAVIVAILLALMIVATILLMPYIRKLADPAVREQFKAWVISLGSLGYLVMIAIQIVQIIIAFIPGEIVEILAGVMYGGFGGLFLCLIGCVIASSGIFLLSKKLGAKFTQRFFSKDNLDRFAYLKDARKLEIVVFILFLLPGTPKDMLTYVAGTTPMRLPQFLLISTFARIPSIVSSTFIGSSILRSNWPVPVLIFSVTALLGILGIVYKDRIMDSYKHKFASGKDEAAPKEE
ncbi:MAG TPA: VTT domain-containing protein [Candidatus Limiplasma sp.]|nr:VTT domain-containing protein [Candidatus Limiplasma sp.]HRX08322.1 VTT domain-containing protein [Candidatus Limiplasma sp.]